MAIIRKKEKKKIVVVILALLILSELVVCLMLFRNYIKKRDLYNTNSIAINTGHVIKKGDKEVILEVAPLFVGDSRTVGMCEAVPNVNNYSQNGTAFYYLEYLDTKIRNTGSDCVVIGFGVNDLGDIDKYIDYANTLGSEMEIPVFYLTVNPVNETQANLNGYYVKNSSIDSFNTKLVNEARYYTVIDTNSFLNEEGFDSYDGLHYNKETYIRIYDFTMDEILKYFNN